MTTFRSRLLSSLLPVSATVALLAASPAAYTTEFVDSVPLALVKVLLQPGNTGDVLLYSGIPDNFPLTSVPGEFTVLGGLDQGYHQRLVLQTSASQEAAIASLTASLTAAGFIPLEQPPRPQPDFVSQSLTLALASTPQLFCRDDVGIISVMFNQQQGTNTLSLSAAGNTQLAFRQPSCAERNQGLNPASGRPVGSFESLARYAPVLTIPGQIGPGPFHMAASGSNDSYETRKDFTSSRTVGDLYRHFSEEVGKQDWLLDNESTGQISANGNWIKVVDDDTYLHGNLSLIQASETGFNVRFRVTRLVIE